MKIHTKKIIPILFIVFFIMPPNLINFISLDLRGLFYYILIFFYWIFGLAFLKPIFFSSDQSKAKNFTLFLICAALLSFIIKNQINLFNIIFPITAYMAYRMALYQKINFVYLFNFSFALLYIVYYFNYYAILPDLFFRPGFNEDILYGSSSNAIPIALNNSLFTYIIFNRLYAWKANKFLYFFSFINLLLITMQGSRSGIVISLFLIFFIVYELNRDLVYRFKYLFLCTFFITVYYATQSLTQLFILTTSDFSSIETYSFLQERRIIAAFEFLNQLSFSNFLFGYPEDQWFGGEQYTFNSFLDFWNRYNLISLIFLIYLIISKILLNEKFFFPNYYLLPFIFYGMVESIYFPGFRDFIIYLIIFTPKHLRFNE
jgi:hypothetical protein